MTPLNDKNLITTKQASELSGYTPDYLARLVRSGKIAGKRIGHSWFIERESLVTFLERLTLAGAPLNDKNLITTKYAGELSGYAPDYLARLARSGKIAGKRIGHSWLLNRESLTRFIDQQGDRKIDRARALARAREEEYVRHQQSRQIVTRLTSRVARALTPPTTPSEPFVIVVSSLRSQMLAFSVAVLVVVSGAFAAKAALVGELGTTVATLAEEASSGFSDAFGNIPARIIARFGAAKEAVLAVSPRVAERTALSSAQIAPPLLAELDASSLQMTLDEAGSQTFRNATPVRNQISNVATTPLITVADIQAFALDAYAFVTDPSHIAESLTNAYLAFGTGAYNAINASLAAHRSLIELSGARALALAATTRDTLAEAPRAVARMNLGLGTAVIEATHAAIRADVSLAYAGAEAAPASARAAVALIGNTGALLAHATEYATVQTPVRVALALRSAGEAGLSAAHAVFNAEYALATGLVALAQDVSRDSLALVTSTGRLVFEGMTLARSLGSSLAAVPGVLTNVSLGALGHVALDTVTARLQSSQVAAVLATTLPALSLGEQTALTTYETVNEFFSSVRGGLAFFFKPPPAIVLPTPLQRRPIGAATSTPSAPRVTTTLTTYPTYTTVVQGVSADFVNQSLATLRGDILATVSGMLQPINRQVATNVTTIQQVNMIEDLTDLIVRNGDFRGGSLTNGSLVSASTGTFTTLNATTLNATTSNLGNVTITGVLTVSGGLSSGTSATAPYFTATSTTATSTFAGRLAVGTSTPWGEGIFTVGTSSPLLYISSNTGRIGIGTSSPAVAFDLFATDALRLPVGTTAQRPTVGDVGYVRYNTTTHQFEGFGDGGYWQGLGGVIDSDLDTYITADTNNTDEDTLRFVTANVERMTITPAGLIGIGTTSPYSLLSISNNLNTAANTPLFTIASTTAGTATSTLLTVLANGNIGVGTSSPMAMLSLANSGAVDGIVLSRSTVPYYGSISIPQDTGYPVKFGGSGTNGFGLFTQATGNFTPGDVKFYQDAFFDGNVGIGTTSPAAGFAVQGTGYVSGSLFVGGALTATSSISTPSLTLSGVSINSLLSTNASGVISATSTPTFGNFNATSTVATSTLSTGGLTVGGTQFVVQQTSGNVGIGTTNPTSPDGTNPITTDTTLALTMYGTQPGINLIASTASGYSSVNFGRVGASSNPYRAQVKYDQANDGLILHAAGYTAFSEGSGEKMRIVNGGNVGIGTTTPGMLLDLYKNQNANTSLSITNPNTGSTADADITFNNSTHYGALSLNSTGFTTGGAFAADGVTLDTNGAGGIGIVSRDTSSTLRFYTGGYTLANERMRIDSTGNIGIGTTTPNVDAHASTRRVLTIQGSSDQGVVEVTSGAADATGQVVGQYSFVAANNNGNKRIGLIAGLTEGSTAKERGGVLQFYTRASGAGGALAEAMRIDSTGKIGIGTSSPYSLLSISNSATTAANTPLFTIASTTGGTSTSTLMTVLASGNVGIGTTSPASKLAVSGGTSIGANYNIAAPTNGLIVQGNVGIGTNAPTMGFQVGEANWGGNSSIYVNAATNNFTLKTNSAAYYMTFDEKGIYQTSVAGVNDFTLSATNHILLTPGSGKNVGVGVASPGSKLQVGGSLSGTAMDFPTIAAGAGKYGFGLSLSGAPTGGNLDTGLYVDNAVGGGTDEAGLLVNMNHLSGSPANMYGLYLRNVVSGGSVTGGNYGLYVTGEVKNYISGSVGIGTTSPYSLLSISNSATTAANTPLFTIASTTAGTSTSTLMTVLASGNVGIGTSNPSTFKLEVAGNIGPEADNTRDLGSGARRFANVYTGNLFATSLEAGSYLNTASGGFGNYQNILVQSEDLSTTWATDNSTVTTNQTTAPDGTSNADKVLENTNNSNHGVYQNATVTNTTYTLSAFVKGGLGRTFAGLWLWDNTTGNIGFYASFNLATGAVDTTGTRPGGGTVSGATITPYPNDWYRISVTGIPGFAAVANAYLAVSSASGNPTTAYTGDAAKGLYWWGAQLVQASNAYVYVRTTTQSVASSTGLVVNGAGPHLFTQGNVGIGTTSPSTLLSLTGGQGTYFTSGGRVGIGTNSPSTQLQVENGYYIGRDTDAQDTRMEFRVTGRSNAFSYGSNAETAATLSVSSPNGSGLGVSGIAADGAHPAFRFQGYTGTTATPTVFPVIYEAFKSDGTASGRTALTGTEKAFSFYSGAYDESGTVLLTMLGGGNVGIGTTTPNQLLSLYSATTPSLNFSAAAAGQWTMGIDTADGYKFKIASSTAVGTNTRLTIDSNGNVGIDNTLSKTFSPVYKHLSVGGYANVVARTGTSAGNYMMLTNNAYLGSSHVENYSISSEEASEYAQHDGIHSFRVAGTGTADNAITWTEAMTIINSGNVGIGTTSPAQMLSVGGSLFVGASAAGGTDGGLGVGVVNTTAGTLQTSGAATIGGTLTLSNGTLTAPAALSITSGGAGDLTLDAGSGTINVASGDDILAVGANSNLGSAGVPFNTLYVDTVNATTLIGVISGGSTNSSDWTINADNASDDTQTMNLIFERGTITPNALLTWNSDGNMKRFELNQPLYIQNASASTTLVTFDLKSVAGQTADIFRIASSSGDYLLNITSAGNVGIGTTSPFTKFSVNGSGFFGGDLTATNITATSSITTPSLTLSGVSVNSLLSTNASGVISATSTPTFGNFNATSTVATSTLSTGGLTVGGTQFVVQQTSGNVGIGTANPQTKLDVQGTASSTAFYANNGSVGAPSYSFGTVSGAGMWWDNSNGVLVFTSNSGQGDLAVRYNGIRVGATTPLGFSSQNQAQSSANDVAFSRLSASKVALGNGTQGDYTGTLIAGNIGIGTTSPYSLLSISNSASTAANTPLFTIASTTGGTSTSTLMTVLANGNVGIGTAAPATLLQLVGGSPTGITFGSSGIRAVKLSSENQVGTTYANSFVLYVNGDTNNAPATEAFRINGNNYAATFAGAVSAPSLTLSGVSVNSLLSTNASGVISATSTPTFGNFNATSTVATSTISTGGLTIGTNQFVVQQTSGNVGIGTASPGAKLEIATAVDGDGIKITQSNPFGVRTLLSIGTSKYATFGLAGAATNSFFNGSVQGDLVIMANQNNSVLLGSDNGSGTANPSVVIKSGNVGIGTTTPDFTLDVNGSNSSALLKLANTSSAAVNNGANVQFNLKDDTGSSIGYASIFGISTGVTSAANAQTGELRFFTKTAGSSVLTQKMVLDTSGNVGIGTTTPQAQLHIIPGTTNTAAGLIVGDVAAMTSSSGFDASNQKIEIGGNAVQSTDSNFAELGLSTNQTGTANIVGTIMFMNRALGTTDKRLGQITVSTNGATNSGDLSFATMNAGTFAEKVRITNAGNVGIGTTSPLELLHVAGVNNTGVMIGGPAAPSEVPGGTYNYLKVIGYSAGVDRGGMMLLGGGWTNNNGGATTVFGTVSGLKSQDNGSTKEGYLSFGTNTGSAVTEKMRITDTGNVGIGTTSPAAGFAVQGTGYVSGSLFVGGTLTATSSITTPSLTLSGVSINSLLSTNASGVISATSTPTFGNFNATSTVATSTISTGGLAIGTNQFVVQQTSGNVGIGTANPGSNLDVWSAADTGEHLTARFLNTNHNTLRLYQYGSANAMDNWNLFDVSGTEQQVGFRIANDNTKFLGLTSTGNVGIGTTTPLNKLTVYGTGNAPASSGTTPNGIASFASANNNNLYFGSIGSSPYAFWMQVQDSANLATTYPLALNPNGGNVGIGTVSPNYKLEVQGTASSTDLYVEGHFLGQRGSASTTIAFGASAGAAVTSATNGVFIGNGAATTITTGANNIAIGRDALGSANAITHENIAIGTNALKVVSGTGAYNNAIGYQSGMGITDGQDNALFGYQAGGSVTTGNGNTFLGNQSGENVTTGGSNTAIGHYALRSAATSAAGNVALGNYAGYYETGSNAFYVNNVDQTNTATEKSSSLLYGTFSGTAGSLTGQKLVVNGNLGVGTTSPYSLLSLSNNLNTTANTPLFTIASTTGGTSTTTVLTVLANGYVGIGKTPQSPLEVVNTTGSDSAGGIVVSRNGTPAQYITINERGGSAHWIGGLGSKGFYFTNQDTSATVPGFEFDVNGATDTGGGTRALVIMNSGNIGISQTSPTYTLDVTGTGHFTSFVDAANFIATSTTASQFPYASTTMLSAFGSLAIGTTSTTTIMGDGNTSTIYGPLAVRGTSSQGSLLTLQRGNAAGDNSLSFNDQVGTQLLQLYTAANTGYAYLTGYQSYLSFGTSVGGETLRIDTSRNSRFSGHVIPTTDLTYDLGTTAAYWNHLYAAYASTTQVGSTGNAYLATAGGSVGIGTTSPAAGFAVHGTGYISGSLFLGGTLTATGTVALTPAARTSGATPYFTLTGAADTGLTASTEAPDVQWNLARTKTHANGTITLQRDMLVNAATHAFTSFTSGLITDLATVGITGAPLLGTNATSTNSHTLYLGASALNASTTNSYGLTVNANTGATNNYAAAFLGGNVGIGTTTPDYKLHVVTGSDSDNSGLRVVGSTQDVRIMMQPSGPYLGTFSAHDLRLGTSNSEKIRITTGGNVGIGTTTPDVQLTVNTSSDYALALEDSTTGAVNNSVAQVFRLKDDSGGLIEYGALDMVTTGITNAANAQTGRMDFYVKTAGVNRAFTGTPALSINAGGKIGIGTTTPNQKLSIFNSAADSAIEFSSLTGDPYKWTIGQDYSDAGKFKISSSTALGTNDRFVIDGSGNIGIGTASPEVLLEVNKSQDADSSIRVINANSGTGAMSTILVGESATAGHYGYLRHYGDNFTTSGVNMASTTVLSAQDAGGLNIGTTNSSAPMRFYTGGSADSNERLRITSAGNVGIGTAAPGAKLQINQAAGENVSAFRFSDADLAHGVTSVVPTDTVFNAGTWGSSTGGAYLIGLSNGTNSSPGMILEGILGSTDPADSLPAFRIVGSKKSGTGEGAIGTLETVLEVENGTAGAGTKLLTILGGGSVGIGTTTPNARLHVVNASADLQAIFGDTTRDTIIQMAKSSGGGAYVNALAMSSNLTVGQTSVLGRTDIFGGTTSGLSVLNTGFVGVGTTSPLSRLAVSGGASIGADYNIAAPTNGLIVEGNVGIGTTAPDLRLAQKLDIATLNDQGGMALTSWNNVNSNASVLDFKKSRGTSIGTHTIVQDGDTLGQIVWRGSDGTAFRDTAAIGVSVDGTPGASDMPGRITFSTTPDGTAASLERMRITNTGNVGIGTTSPYANLSVQNNYGSTNSALFSVASSTAANSSTASTFLTVLASGLVGIGTTAPNARLQVVGRGPTVNFGENALALGTHNGADSILTIERYSDAFPVATIRAGFADNDTGVGIDLQYRDSTGAVQHGLYINSSGNVGIGTTTPLSKLAVSGGASIGADYNIAAPTNGLIVEGNVGIGTTSPLATLSIQPATSVTPFIVASSTGATMLSVNADGSLSAKLKQLTADYTVDSVGSNISAGDIVSYINGKARRATVATGTPVTASSTDATYVAAALLDSTHFVVAYRVPTIGFVEAVVGTVSNTSITFGTPVQLNAANSNYISITALDSTHFAVAYQNAAVSNFLYAVVSTVSGTTITPGTPAALNSSNPSNYTSAGTLDSTHFVVAYHTGAGAGSVLAVVSSVSGTTITPGTPASLDSAPAQTTGTAVLDSTHFAVSYQESGSTFLRAIAASVSGTTITPGSSVELDGVIPNTPDAEALDSTHFVTAYANSTALKAVVASVSGTTITAGTSVTLDTVTGGASFISVAAFDSTHFVAAYKDTDVNYATAAFGSVSGTTITAGTVAALNSVNSQYTSVIAVDTTRFVTAYQNATNNRVDAVTAQSAGSSLLGMATNTGSLDGSVTVATNGIVSGLTGLTAGSTYYFSGASGLSTTSSSYKVGVALSTSSLLLNSGSGAGSDQFFGDMIFSNNFRITESQTSPQALLFKNQLNHQILSLDERGDLTLPGVLTAARFQTTGSAFTLAENGNLGLGTTSPYARLSIQATAGGVTPLFAIASSTSGAATSTVFYVAANGTVGIGTNTPSHTLEVAGDIGAISFVNTSTRDAKTDITYLTSEEASTTLARLESLKVATYRYKIEDQKDPLRLGLISEDAQTLAPEILAPDGRGVDIYKLATFTLAGVQALAAKVGEQETRLVSLETRIAAIESGAVSSASGSPVSFSSSSIASALEGFGVFIQKGIAQFGTLVFDQFVAATDSTGASSAGAVTILAGNTVAEVTNAYVKPTSKIFVTLTASTTGSWYVSDKQSGSFRLTLSEVQPADVSFDYFIVQTEGQVATSTPATSLGGETPKSSSIDTEAPVIILLGDNPVRLPLGGAYVEPGVTVTDAVDGTGTYATFVNGIEVPDPAAVIDTGSEATYIITYSATDQRGNLATATRSVIVGASGSQTSDTTPPTDTTATTTASTTPPADTTVPVDTTAPVVTLSSEAAVQLTVGGIFIDSGATAADDTDGDLTASIAVTGAVDTATAGSYTLTYTATDAAGNSGSASRTVTVLASSTSSPSDSTATSTPAI